ncbi:MAG: molybdopterin-dependent oxidoreductase [Spirochaetia bacterium]|nr:molybdopterin-dependent oxidoreductase [Spirochaetia bacterium]MCE1210237.1 molybdopterin-dependent oxidoreductase [Spirochaetia bacterium]NLX46224.1 molybdopterin-dependent oxidoreductase [Treponema sp.]HOI23607.1 molybdopterin-dependent oxidoreductase [Spirochaetales bacterium]
MIESLGIMKLPVFCGRDCGGNACPLLASLENGRVVGIGHNPAAGEFLRGCPKGFALPAQHYSPHRIRQPLIRKGPRGSGRFVESSWEQVLALIAEKLAACRADHGALSLLCLSSAGSTGALHNTEKLTLRFLRATGGCSAVKGNYSSNAAAHALKKALGLDYLRSGFDPATVDKAGLIVLWGANVLEARLGAELPARLVQASKRAVPIVSIDPRRTGTGRILGAEWIPILPGADSAMMYALLFLFLRFGAVEKSYLDARVAGFDRLASFVLGRSDGQPKDPAWAEKRCGVEAKKIEELARRWISAKPVMLIPGYSIQRTEKGEEAMRLCLALQLASGNFGLPGASTGSINNKLPGPRVGSLSEGEAGGEGAAVPVLRWPDAILGDYAPLKSPIKAVYTAGGNFLNQGADIRKNIRAFESLDFAVCHELFLTPTAAYCDVVLPAASPLQKEDIGIPWGGNYLLYKPRVLPLEGMERSDYDIFAELSSLMGGEDAFTEGLSESQWIHRFIAESEIRDVDAFKTSGIYFGREQERSGLGDFAADPVGRPLKTASGKVELDSPFWGGFTWPAPASRPGRSSHAGPPRAKTAGAGVALASGASVARSPRSDQSPPGEALDTYTFLLISPKERLRVHSQWGHRPDEILRSRLVVNEGEAGQLGLADGQELELFSASGSTLIRLSLSPDIMPGVVSIYEGSWCSDDQGRPVPGSANYLTSTLGTEESISCVMHGIPVRLRLPGSA